MTASRGINSSAAARLPLFQNSSTNFCTSDIFASACPFTAMNVSSGLFVDAARAGHVQTTMPGARLAVHTTCLVFLRLHPALTLTLPMGGSHGPERSGSTNRADD